MAIEFFNFGVNATSEVASKLQKIANNEVQKETDEMFGRLHEDYIKEQEREDAAKKKADYNPYEDEERQQEQKQRGGYNPDDYERVAFSGAVGAKNQALYFAQYMKDQGVNDVVVSPVKINGEYMVEIPKTAMIREKIEPEQEQPTVTKLNHDEQDFLRRQLENVAAQEEAKKPKPAEPEMTEAVTDVTAEPQQAAAQPVPEAEPAYSEPDTYESSYTEHTDTAEPVYDQNIPAADPMQAETTENAQVEAESVAPAPENSYNSSFGMESTSSTEPFSAYGDVQPDEAVDYGSTQHNDNTGYIPKGLEPDFTSQQTTVADKATAEPQEAKTNPFSNEPVFMPSTAPEPVHTDSQSQPSPSYSGYTSSFEETSAESQNTASTTPYSDFLSNYDNMKTLERIVETGEVRNDNDRRIMQEFVALTNNSFGGAVSAAESVNLTQQKEPEMTSVRLNENEKSFVQKSMDSTLMGQFLEDRPDVAEAMETIQEKGKITTPHERQMFLDYQNAMHDIATEFHAKTGTEWDSNSSLEAKSLASKASFMRTESAVQSLNQKFQADDKHGASTKPQEHYRNVAKSAEQLIADFTEKTDIDVKQAGVHGQSDKSKEIQELRDEQEQGGLRAVESEEQKLFTYTFGQMGLFGKTVNKSINAVNDLAKYSAVATNKRIFEEATLRQETFERSSSSMRLGAAQKNRGIGKAIVFGNDMVVINGEIVTDEKIRGKVLAEHHKRVAQSAQILQESARRKEKVKEKQGEYDDAYKVKKDKYYATHQEELADFAKQEKKRKDAFDKKEDKRYADFIKSGRNPDEFIRREYQARGFYKKKKKIATEHISEKQERMVRNAQTIQNNLYRQEYAAPVVTKSGFRDGGSLDEIKNTINTGAIALGASVTIALSQPELDFIRKNKSSFTAEQRKVLEKVMRGESISVYHQKKVLSEWSETMKHAAETGKIKLSDDDAEVLKSLGNKVKLSDGEKAIFARYDKFAQNLKKDLNLDFIAGGITRADVLKINEAFLKRAENKGYQFITATGKFDVAALGNLTAKQLKELGISNSTRNALMQLNNPKAWGALDIGVAAKLAQKGMSGATKLAGNDEDMRAMISGGTKTYRYARKTTDGVKNTVKAIQKHQDAMKAKFANVKKTNRLKNVDSVKPPKKKPTTKKAAKPNPKRNERFLAKQEKKLARLQRSENSVFGKARGKINGIKAKFMNSKVGMLVQKVQAGVSKAMLVIGKYVAIGILFVATALTMFVVVMTIIESFTNFLAAKTYKDTVCYKLYESLEEQETSWKDTIVDYEGLWDDKANVTYGTKGMSYSDYLKRFDNLLEADTQIAINPWHQKDAVASLSNNTKYLTYLDAYNGEKELRMTANANLYGKLSPSADEAVYYSSTESGHTSNIKDIISMTDVMYQFETDANSDKELGDVLGMSPAELNWENFKNRFTGFFKMLGNNISEFVKNLFGGKEDTEPNYITWADASGTTFSYKTLQNYTATLFSASHQQTWDYTVKYCSRLGNPTVKVNGSIETIDKLSESEAAELGYCTNPKVEDFYVGIERSSDDSPQPYIIGSDFKRYYTNHAGAFDITVDTNKNLNGSKNDLCLWSGMTSNKTTFDAVVTWISNHSGKCWSSKTVNPSSARISGGIFNYNLQNKNGKWFDSESGAKTDISNKLRSYRDTYHLPDDAYHIYREEGDYSVTRLTKDFATKSNSNPNVGTLKTNVVQTSSKQEKRCVYIQNATKYTTGNGYVYEQGGKAEVPILDYTDSTHLIIDKTNDTWKDEVSAEQTNYNNINGKEKAYFYMPIPKNEDVNDFANNYLKDSSGNYLTIDKIYQKVKNRYQAGGNVYHINTTFVTNYMSWDDLNYMIGRVLTARGYTGQSYQDEYDLLTSVIWYRVAIQVNTNIKQYKKQYRYENGSIEIYRDSTTTLTRKCKGHSYQYCGGHLGVISRGNVFSMTNEQLALVGTYNEDYQFPVQMDWSDDRYDEIRGKVITDKVNYSDTVSDAAWSGGSETPASDVQGSYMGHSYGLNLYVEGGNWKEGFHVVGESDSEENKQYLCRDIFDVDEMVLKGSNCFGTKDWDDYEGWNGDNMTLAVLRQTMDWQDVYEFDIPTELGAKVLCQEDIDKIVDALKKKYGSSFNDSREQAVRIALSWVGKAHYNDEDGHNHGLVQSYCVAADRNFNANCTAGTAWDFIRMYSSWTGQTATQSNTIDNSKAIKSPSASLYLPADIIRHVRSVSAGALVSSDNVNIDANDVNEINNSGSNEALLMMKRDLAVVYIGELNEDLELSDGTTIKAGQSLTVDLSPNKDIGTIYLRRTDATSLCNIGKTKTYYYVKNPDGKTWLYRFDCDKYKAFEEARKEK
ncbi:hypothetical protein DW025_01005 [Coprococcus sp. AF38-1]|uniref:hypothetical protein n=2 Tax=Coprococcus TaxID=33042 RepID=UPI000E747607|nr:hypothetical protein [Coprococcus sp. AF38-1]RJW77235.1 hypothetical protein DW025_01005 [Coprococcus sp. AF38-1]